MANIPSIVGYVAPGGCILTPGHYIPLTALETALFHLQFSYSVDHQGQTKYLDPETSQEKAVELVRENKLTLLTSPSPLIRELTRDILNGKKLPRI